MAAAPEESLIFERKLLQIRREKRSFCILCEGSEATYSQDGFTQHCKRWHQGIDQQRSWKECQDELQKKVLDETRCFLLALSESNKLKAGQECFKVSFEEEAIELWTEDHHTASQMVCILLEELGRLSTCTLSVNLVVNECNVVNVKLRKLHFVSHLCEIILTLMA
jgi:hypothetical protein